MIIVESAGLTDVGKKRKGNEDALFLDDDLKLFIVADGMGGHQAGEIASDLVVKTIKDYMERFNGDTDVEELGDSDKSLSKNANRLISGINLSNNVVFHAGRNKASYRGMGSTVSAVYFTNDTVISTNVGDSPIYLVRNGEIETLSVTHTVLAEHNAMNREGDIQFGKEYSHMLTRAMGVEESVKADVCEFPCYKNDILVLASDGLSNKVSPEEILKTVQHKKPIKSCQELVNLANDRGGDDNITVITIKVKMVRHHKGGLLGLIGRIFGLNK